MSLDFHSPGDTNYRIFYRKNACETSTKDGYTRFIDRQKVGRQRVEPVRSYTTVFHPFAGHSC